MDAPKNTYTLLIYIGVYSYLIFQTIIKISKHFSSMKKRVPLGSVIYMLHTKFNGETYSFIGNKQVFSHDFRTTYNHLGDLTYMFGCQVDFATNKQIDYGLDYCFIELNYYPYADNINRTDQKFLNDEKRKYLAEYKQIHTLSNLILYKDDTNVIKQFIRYNNRQKRKIKDWGRNDAVLMDFCLLGEWLEGRDVNLINKFPRYLWFDDAYEQILVDLDLMPTDERVVMTLMLVKDDLPHNDYADRLRRFAYYRHSEDQAVLDTLSTWKIHKYISSPTRNRYVDSLAYASGYMYGFCCREGYDNNGRIANRMMENEPKSSPSEETEIMDYSLLEGII